jgi:hypothetical protein
MKKKFEVLMLRLFGSCGEKRPLTGINISSQFQPGRKSKKEILMNLNSSFLIALCGKSHPMYESAINYLKSFENSDPDYKRTAFFYSEGLRLISDEIERVNDSNFSFNDRIDELYRWLSRTDNSTRLSEYYARIWEIFFPEGVGLFDEKQANIEAIRKKRTINITSRNENPLKDPASELIITSNVLLTLPPSLKGYKSNDISAPLFEKLETISGTSQIYWYDHPERIGEKTEKSEIVYGLRGLDNAVAFEKKRGVVAPNDKIRCILSISVTHSGLEDPAKEWLVTLLGGRISLPNLIIYAFNESDTARIIEEIFEPVALKYLGKSVRQELKNIFGVNGQYGRHYSFLKAISALWQVFFDPGLRATFKIDLDQVFPQDRLIKETGCSAFEHFMTPLWGAEGIDNCGKKVELGMLAGALVNHSDIENSIFTPDIKFPKDEMIKPEEWIFCSRLPQAVSTEAEMMMRYGNGDIDGKGKCIQRVHVTGGTCGILVKSLREHMPFTPSFVGRAEDQAYILSVLCEEKEPGLRYLHADGLIMRHDKEVFAGDAIKAASIGKMIGDFERILVFSLYGEALPWDLSEIKYFVDPFTGCFISRIPATLVFLGFAVKGASLFNSGMMDEGSDFINMGSFRLLNALDKYGTDPGMISDIYSREKTSWEEYYAILEIIENSLLKGDSFTLGLKKRMEDIVSGCRIIS